MNASRQRRLLLAVLLLCLQAAAAGFSKVTVEADTDKKQLRVGETLKLKVVVLQAAAGQGEAMASMGSPELPPLPGFQVYFTKTAQNVNMVNNVMQLRSETEYDMTATVTGKQMIPAITYSYIDPETHQQLQLQSHPIEVEVLPAAVGIGNEFLWEAGLGLMGAAVLALLITARGRRTAPPAAEPEVVDAGSNELRRLRFFLESKQVESFYGAVSDTIRAALERRYGIPAQVQTTAELVSLLQEKQVDAATLEAVRHCLARCDLAKFAGYSSSPEEMHQTYVELMELLDKPQPPPAAPAEES